LEQAKAQIKVTSTADDADIALKLADAEAIILDYLKSQADASWTEETVPGPVRAAILRQFADLYRFRGDHPSDARTNGEDLAPGVTMLLRRLRDPALA
jgi:hypothetical protein